MQNILIHYRSTIALPFELILPVTAYNAVLPGSFQYAIINKLLTISDLLCTPKGAHASQQYTKKYSALLQTMYAHHTSSFETLWHTRIYVTDQIEHSRNEVEVKT